MSDWAAAAAATGRIAALDTFIGGDPPRSLVCATAFDGGDADTKSRRNGDAFPTVRTARRASTNRLSSRAGPAMHAMNNRRTGPD